MTRLQRCVGCGLLVSPGPRCAECRRKADRAYFAIYRTHAWRLLSEKVRRAGSRCVWCLRPLPYSRRVADHVEPVEKRPDLALEPTNVVVACNSCNQRRGRNWKLPDPDEPTPTREEISVGARMAAIHRGDAA